MCEGLLLLQVDVEVLAVLFELLLEVPDELLVALSAFPPKVAPDVGLQWGLAPLK